MMEPAIGGTLEAGISRLEGAGKGKIVRLSLGQGRACMGLRLVLAAAIGQGWEMMEE